MLEKRVLAEQVYEWVGDKASEDSTCEGMPESACKDTPKNYLLNASNGAATKFAEQLASPDLVLAWLLSVLSAPVVLRGLLEPIRCGGAMLPQLAVSGHMRAYSRRKWFWVAAGAIQALAVLPMLVAALALTDT
jgi:hypothetical protein